MPIPTDTVDRGGLPLLPLAKRTSAVMSGTYDTSNVTAVLVAVSVVGYALMGVFAVLLINGLLGHRTRAASGRWVPDWYLDARGSRSDKAWLCGWWATVIVFWPFLLVGLLARSLCEKVAGAAKARRDKKERLGGSSKGSGDEVPSPGGCAV